MNLKPERNELKSFLHVKRCLFFSTNYFQEEKFLADDLVFWILQWFDEGKKKYFLKEFIDFYANLNDFYRNLNTAKSFLKGVYDLSKK